MKRGFAALATLLITGSGFAGTATAEPAQGFGWRPCPENVSVECASLTVPLDWDRPAKGTITVAVARRQATDPTSKIGTLVYLPGGPGDSGVRRVLGGELVPPAVAARFDVVSFDPRGTNRSNPVTCDATLLANQPNVIPDAGATLAAVKAYSKQLGDSCREHTGPLVDHVDNVSVAHDIDALRAALGERKISLYGRSYGTLAGQMYAENFPRRVRAMVLDSVFDHSLPAGEFVTTQARGGEDSFTEFAKWCAADARCALHGRDAGAVYGEVYEKSVRGELTEPGDPSRPVATIDLIREMLNHFYLPDWTAAANRLKALADQEPSTWSAAATLPFAMGSFCADHRVRISSQQEWTNLWRQQEKAAPTMRAHFAWRAVSMCAAWPAAVTNPQHRTDVAGAPPILLTNSRFDPATPYEWATSVERQLKGSVLLTYDGWGHGVLERNDCTIAAFTTYLMDGTTPKPGSHCPASEGMS